MTRRCFDVLRQWAVMLLLGVLAIGSAEACVGGACVQAGARLASVNSTQGTLLNALMSTLLGSSVNLSVADWNAMAQGNVSLAGTVGALQTTLGVASPSAALTTNATLAQVITATAAAAASGGNPTLAAALNDMASPLVIAAPIKLGNLINSNGLFGTTQINALELVTGAVQLFNTTNVATTPTPIAVNGSALGLSSLLTTVSISATVINPPVYVCGVVGSTFNTASIRVLLDMSLNSLSLNAAGLNLIPGIANASITLTSLKLYVEIGTASGIITAINAISNTLTVQATPGVANLYLGTMDPTVFFNRSHVINAATDLTPGTVGGLQATILAVPLVNVSIGLKSAVLGQSPTATTLNYTGAYPQTQTAYTTVSGFESSLVTSLMNNLVISISPDLGTLDTTVLATLKTILQSGLLTPVTTILSSVVDPLLSDLGVRIGEVDVTASGTYYYCSVSGNVYADPNHNAVLDSGEAGTGATLYAKLVPTSAPTAAVAVATVDPTTGVFTFASVQQAIAYSVIVSTNATLTVVTPAGPAGWIPTQTPTLSLGVTVAAADITAQNYGLYHGSQLQGLVWKDNGAGTGGLPNNGLKDGSEAVLQAIGVSVTDSTGNTVYDSSSTGPAGTYTLWIPSTAGANALKVRATVDGQSVGVSGNAGSTGGTFAIATLTTSFTNVIGTAYTGVNFGQVPMNRLDDDGQQTVAAGSTAYFPHVFHAGTGGQLSFTLTPNAPLPTGWSAVPFLDTNCNGTLDANETPITAATTVVADQVLCIIVKVFVPETAANNLSNTIAVSASLAYTNTTLVLAKGRQDLVITGVSNGLRLVKSADKSTASSGDTITYTITYLNQGVAGLTALKIHDATPAYTVFASAACGLAPATITACALTAQPAVNASGSVEWTLTGTVNDGASGTVVFAVKVQ